MLHILQLNKVPVRQKSFPIPRHYEDLSFGETPLQRLGLHAISLLKSKSPVNHHLRLSQVVINRCFDYSIIIIQYVQIFVVQVVKKTFTQHQSNKTEVMENPTMTSTASIQRWLPAIFLICWAQTSLANLNFPTLPVSDRDFPIPSLPDRNFPDFPGIGGSGPTPTCVDGYVWNPVTQQCVNLNDDLPPLFGGGRNPRCIEDLIWNPITRQCEETPPIDFPDFPDLPPDLPDRGNSYSSRTNLFTFCHKYWCSVRSRSAIPGLPFPDPRTGPMSNAILPSQDGPLKNWFEFKEDLPERFQCAMMFKTDFDLDITTFSDWVQCDQSLKLADEVFSARRQRIFTQTDRTKWSQFSLHPGVRSRIESYYRRCGHPDLCPYIKNTLDAMNR